MYSHSVFANGSLWHGGWHILVTFKKLGALHIRLHFLLGLKCAWRRTQFLLVDPSSSWIVRDVAEMYTLGRYEAAVILSNGPLSLRVLEP